jgi:creatinine amidohydrolase
MRAVDLTSPEYAQRIGSQIAVLPIGAVEAHGPHLTLGTDILIADFLADELASRIGAVVLPTVSYGCQTNPLRLGGYFPGNLDVRARTLADQVLEILQCAYRDGARRFFVLHTSYANVPIVYDGIDRFVATAPGARVMAGSWWDFATEETRNAIAAETGVPRTEDHHAALVETSLVMHISPSSVRDSLLADDQSARRARYTVLPLPEDLETGTGVVFRADRASSEIGKRLTAEILGNMVDAVRLELEQATA